MNHRFLHIVIVALVVLLLMAPVEAARKTTGIGEEYPTLMRGPRPLGMGNAFLAMPGSDYNAPFYNPAAINDYPAQRHYQALSPTAGFDPHFFDMVTDLLTLRRNLHSATTNAQKIAYFDQFTRTNTGSFHTFETGMPLAQVRHRRYALTLIADNRSVISLRNQAFPNFEFRTRSNIGVVAGGALGFFDDQLQVGANAKLLFGMFHEDRITTADILLESIRQLIGFGSWAKGFGGGVDLGVKWRMPLLRERLRPTLALTVQDLVGTYYTGDVAKMPMSISIGAGIFPELGPVALAFLVDFRELNKRMDFLNRFHAGLEARFPEVWHTTFSLRAGCNQGYPTGGFSAAWPIVTLTFAFYGEEAGHYTSSKPDYRLMTQLGFSW